VKQEPVSRIVEQVLCLCTQVLRNSGGGGKKVAVPVIDILDPGNFVFCTGTDADLFSD
jgi:hypothetical protein